MNKTYSLRLRLIAWISISILLATTLTFFIGSMSSWHEIEEVYDAQLVHSAKILHQLTQHEITQDDKFDLGIESSNLEHKYERKIGFRIWANANLITQSPNTIGFESFEAPPGFSDHQIDGHKWRFFVFLDPANKIQIEVSERYDIRYELIEQIMTALIAPGIIFIPMIFIIVWVGVRKTLKPIMKFSVDMDARSTDDFSSIEKCALAEEIAPLVNALNRLFSRIGESFRREREFTDHAAHELRTPLAAMKTQTQVLMKKAGGMPECADGLENLQSSIDRATGLVDQLLSLARLQNEEFPKAKFNLSECLHDSIAEVKSRAKGKNITLHTEISGDVFISGHESSVAILFRNLLDNAVKYTRKGEDIWAHLSKDALIEISDNGPGINDKDKKTVFQRFTRADKTGQPG